MMLPAEKKFTVVEHLEELRIRIIRSLLVVIIVSCGVYYFSEELLRSIAQPVGTLVFLEPAEAFLVRIKVAFLGGLLLSSPLVVFETWQFIAAGLHAHEKKYVLYFAPFSFLFFILGSAFGYYVIVPVGVRFLLGYATDFMIPMITANHYLSFVGMLVVVFGVVFQLPLLGLFLTKMGIITPVILARKRRHAIVVIFIAAAALTPPDVVSQFLLAVPLIVLYEIGIMFSKAVYRPRPHVPSK